MFLKEEELKLLPEDSLQALALCWSAKEAVYKLAGEKAGAMGERVVIDIDEVAKIVASEDKKREFHARVDKEEFLLNSTQDTIHRSLHNRRCIVRHC